MTFVPFLKAAAVGGIFAMWAKLTIEAFSLSWHIISTSPEKETYKAITMVKCDECGELFNDENICFPCRGEFSSVD